MIFRLDHAKNTYVDVVNQIFAVVSDIIPKTIDPYWWYCFYVYLLLFYW